MVKAGSSLRPSRKNASAAGDDGDDHEVDDERAAADRPFGQVEADHRRALAEQADLLARPQRLHAGGDDDVARLQPLRDDQHARRIEAQHLDRCAAPRCCVAGSTTQTAGWRSRPRQRRGGDLDRRRRRRAASARSTVEPSRIAARRIVQPDPDLEGAGHRIGARRDLPHAADGASPPDPWSAPPSITGSAGAWSLIARRHVEDGVAAVLARDLHDHAAGLHDLAGLGAARGHGAGGIGDAARYSRAGSRRC